MIPILCAMVALYALQSLFCRIYVISRGGAGGAQFTVCYSLAAGALTLAINGFAFEPSATTLALGIANAAVLLIYNIGMIRAGNMGSYAFMMVSVLSGGILVPMLYDAIFVSLGITALRAAAAAIMIASFILMNSNGLGGKKSGGYLLWCAVLFLANGAYGVLMHLQQSASGGAQRCEMIITTFVGSALIAAITHLTRSRREFLAGFRMSRRSAAFLALSAICATAAVNLLLYIITRMNLTALNVVNNGGVLALSAVFAVVIFKEKLDARRALGIVLACASIVLLSL